MIQAQHVEMTAQADVFREVSNEVAVEPRLQPLNGEILPRPPNKEVEARLDIRARGFWDSGTGRKDALFYVRVFHTSAPSYQNHSLSSPYRQHECEKRLAYGRRVLDVERGAFTPLVFTSGGRMSKETTAAMKPIWSATSAQSLIRLWWVGCGVRLLSVCRDLRWHACEDQCHALARDDFTSISEATADGRIAYWENVLFTSDMFIFTCISWSFRKYFVVYSGMQNS